MAKGAGETSSKAERVIALVLGQGFNVVLNFFFLPYFVRVLSKTEYGTYGEVVLVSDIARQLLCLGIASVVYITMARSKNKHDDFRTILVTGLVQGLVGTAFVYLSAGFFAGRFHSPGIAPLLRLYSFNVLFYIPFQSLSALVIFLGRSGVYLRIFTIALVARVSLVVGAVELFHHSLVAVFVALLIHAVLQFSLGVMAVPREFFTRGRFHLKAAFEHLQLGLSLGLTDLLAFTIAYTDRYLVSSMLTIEDFATYRNGAIELPVIGTLYSSIAAVMLPSIASYYSEGRIAEIVKLKRKLMTTCAATIYPAVFFLMIFSHPLIVAYFSAKYAASAMVFGVLVCEVLFRINDYRDVLVSSGRARYLVVIYGATALLNVLVCSTLIKTHGYLGAASSVIVMNLLMYTALVTTTMSVLKRPILALIDWKKLAAIIVISAAPTAALRYWAPGSDHVVVALIYGAISAGFAYFAFLKTGIIDYADVAPLVKRVPGLGARVDALIVKLL